MIGWASFHLSGARIDIGGATADEYSRVPPRFLSFRAGTGTKLDDSMGEIRVVRGGRVVRVERDGSDLLLVIARLRRYGLGWKARLRLAEAGTPQGLDERSGAAARPLHSGWDVEALRFDGAQAVLQASRSTGPGDRDVVTYALTCRAVRISVRPSLRGTLIRLASI